MGGVRLVIGFLTHAHGIGHNAVAFIALNRSPACVSNDIGHVFWRGNIAVKGVQPDLNVELRAVGIVLVLFTPTGGNFPNQLPLSDKLHSLF